MGMNSAPNPSPTMAMFNFRSLMACVQEFPTLILRNNRAAMRGMTPFPLAPVNGKVPGLFCHLGLHQAPRFLPLLHRMEERVGRGGAFLLVSPLLGPLPTRSSRGEDGELDAALAAVQGGQEPRNCACNRREFR